MSGAAKTRAPRTTNATAPLPKAAKGRARKVWSGARKKLGVSPLQLALPGIGMSAL